MIPKFIWWIDKTFWNAMDGFVFGYLYGSGHGFMLSLVCAFPLFFIGLCIGTRDKKTGERLNS